MNIIVTGTSKGIGYSIVENLCKENDCKIIGIARSMERLQQLKGKCEQWNPKSRFIPLSYDLTKILEEYKNIENEILNHVNQVDILINNAGYLVNKPFEMISTAEIDQVINTNYKSVAIFIKMLLPLFKQKAHVVNIGSMGGFQGSSKFPGLSFYSSSKAALANLTECLAAEFPREKVSFNCLALGAAQT
ncbi:MAG: SDR family NAD(P)-dependent oxidoreductase, partial [bacterium]